MQKRDLSIEKMRRLIALALKPQFILEPDITVALANGL